VSARDEYSSEVEYLIGHSTLPADEVRRAAAAIRAEALTAAADDLHDMWRQTENAQQAGGIALAMHRIRDLAMAASQGSTARDEQAEDPIPSALAAKADLLDHLERHTLPQLRREIEWHQAGKRRWRKRAESAEAERDEHRAAAERAEAKLRKIEYGCETPESHNYGCPCETKQEGQR
jgi:hypothetical protein